MERMGAAVVIAVAALFGCLCGCVYPNPNVNTYGWQPPPGPSPDARSYMGYDPTYEERLISRYTATHPDQVRTFRTQQLGL
jgi:hypothetical protein